MSIGFTLEGAVAVEISTFSSKFMEIYRCGEHCIAAERDLSGYHPSLMPIPGVSPESLHVSAGGKYSVKVLFRDALNGTLKYEEDVASLLDIMTDYVVCPGLKIAPEIKLTSMRTWVFPFGRIDSERCSLLHRPQNKKQVPGSDLFNVCFNCKKLSQKLKEMTKIRNNNGENCVKSSSNSNWRFLSPKSAKNRYRNLMRDVRRLAKEVERLNKKIRVSLSADSSHQMENITKKISSVFQNELDQIFEEAKGSGDLLKRIWQQDVDERKAFWKDQNRNGRH